MKNYLKFFGIIVLVMIIGLSMTACGGNDDDSGGGGGTVTITGLSTYDGKYIMGFGDDAGSSFDLFAAANININTGTVTAAQISGGSVTLKIWKSDPDVGIESYNGSDQDVEFMFAITDISSISLDDFFDDAFNMIAVTETEMNFTNGVGTFVNPPVWQAP